MRTAQFAAVFSLALLGLMGACLIFAQSGFTTASKRTQWSVFVPAPEAYVMAAIMLLMSALAGLWLLQQVRANVAFYFFSIVAYVGLGMVLTRLFVTYLQ